MDTTDAQQTGFAANETPCGGCGAAVVRGSSGSYRCSICGKTEILPAHYPGPLSEPSANRGPWRRR